MNATKSHGTFENIQDGFLEDMSVPIAMIDEVLRKWGKTDIDTSINEYRDSVVSKKLGFPKVNVEKHGWDGASENVDNFIEVKQASISAKSIGATFNDTSIEKTEEISVGLVTIALAVWESINCLKFVVYGNNPKIGDLLKEKIEKSRKNNSIRPGTQTITMRSLIKDFGFKVKVCDATKEEVSDFLLNEKRLKRIIDKVPFDDET